MAHVLVDILSRNAISADEVTVEYEAVLSEGGHSIQDNITGNLSTATPAQGVTALKNQVKAWALTHGVTVTNQQIWVFGAPQ